MTERSPSRFKGKTYEATYLGWLDFFQELANVAERIRVVHAPACWSPLLRYMGHVVSNPAQWFLEDKLFEWPSTDTYEACRRVVEVSSTCRPELAHALYLWDTRWSQGENAKRRTNFQKTNPSKEFVVTCHGSMFRHEVLDYLDRLDHWKPPDEYYRRAVILCPAAADKPYPAPLHQAIRDTVPDSYLIVATGVLGLVPEDLWLLAPSYNAGVPFNERVYKTVVRFFRRFPKSCRVIVYSDFLAYWLARALTDADQPFVSIFGVDEIPDYYDLASVENLKSLKDMYECLFIS